MEQQLLLLYSVGVCGQLIRLFNNLYFSHIIRENMSDDLEDYLPANEYEYSHQYFPVDVCNKTDSTIRKTSKWSNGLELKNSLALQQFNCRNISKISI